jgi:hypothetical protein
MEEGREITEINNKGETSPLQEILLLTLNKNKTT